MNLKPGLVVMEDSDVTVTPISSQNCNTLLKPDIHRIGTKTAMKLDS